MGSVTLPCLQTATQLRSAFFTLILFVAGNSPSSCCSSTANSYECH